MGLAEPINFIFDEQSEKGVIEAAWDSFVEGANDAQEVARQ